MQKSFEVRNIRCSGCANTIEKVLRETGFDQISVDLSCEPRKVTIDIENEAQEAQIRAVLRKHGYPFYDEEINLGQTAALKAKSFVSCAVGKFTTNTNADSSASKQRGE